jgi:hypothetical protein
MNSQSLCRMHHREVHRASDERAWWKAANIDPLRVARKFWKDTRLNEGRIAPNSAVKPVEGSQPLQPGKPSGPAPA